MMKVRLTPLYVGAIFIVIIVLVSVLFTIGSWLGWWGHVEVYEMIQTFIINWVVVITFAILGGVLFGMFVGFRLLSSQGFTPFEKSMLVMMVKVDKINEKIHEIEASLRKLEIGERGGKEVQEDTEETIGNDN